MKPSPEIVGHEPKLEPQLILDAIVEGICGVEAQGSATFSNQVLLKMTGNQREECIGQDVHELLRHSRLDGTKYPREECELSQGIKAHQSVHIPRGFLRRKDETMVSGGILGTPQSARNATNRETHSYPHPSSIRSGLD